MKRFHLPNQIRCVLQPWSASAATVTVGVQGGSRDDPVDLRHGRRVRKGLVHFIEHVSFRANRRFLTWGAFVRHLDGIASTYNAYTDKSTILFCVETDRRHVPHVIQVLADSALHPLLTKPNVVPEGERIRQECREYDDDPGERAELDLDRHMFPNHGLGHPILGTEETIRRITVDQLRAYHQRAFVGRRMVVAVAGGFDPDLIEPVIRRSFDAVRVGMPSHIDGLDYRQLSGGLHLNRDTTKQVNCIVGWPTPGINTAERVVLGMVRNALSGRSSSILKLLLDSVGHGYSLRDFYWCYQDLGQYYVHFPMSRDHLLEALEIVGLKIRELSTLLLPEEEWQLTIDNLSIGARARFGEPWEASTFIAKQLLNGRRFKPVQTYLRELRQVTREQIRDVARKVLRPERMTAIIRGPINGLSRADCRRALGM